MARIRHIALATEDPDATAKFYIDGLDDTINFFNSATIQPVTAVPSMGKAAQLALVLAIGLGIVVSRKQRR